MRVGARRHGRLNSLSILTSFNRRFAARPSTPRREDTPVLPLTMWLLNTSTLRLEEFLGESDIPPCAILSHTWGEDELLFKDLDPTKNPEIGKLATAKAGLGKVLGAVNQAVRDGHTYIWIDTCCIDKSSSAELSEAINSMYAWYSKAKVCYAYLSDFLAGDLSIEDSGTLQNLGKSRWFTRGWTLQELIAPECVCFFDKDWVPVGTRLGLAQRLTAITGIPRKLLMREQPRDGFKKDWVRHSLDEFSVSARMLWAANRQTTRSGDQAYSLMGLFDVNMPLLYGEGAKAFRRLQEIILAQTNDQSILAFDPKPQPQLPLAEHPRRFISNLESSLHRPTKPMSLVSGDIEVDVLLCELDSTRPGMWNHEYDPSWYLAFLHCNIVGHFLRRIGIMLQPVDVDRHTFTRADLAWMDALKEDRFPVCFELDSGNGSDVWAVARGRHVDPLFDPKGLRIAIGHFENRRILITPRHEPHLRLGHGRRVTKIPLQISLRGVHSDEFYLKELGGSLSETVEGYHRQEVPDKETEPPWRHLQRQQQDETFENPRNLSGPKIERLGHFDVLYRETETDNIGWTISSTWYRGFRVIWGVKLSQYQENWDLREDEMVCFVRPLKRVSSNTPQYNIPVERTGRVSAVWNKQLGMVARVEIWAETLLDRTCAFLEVTISASEEPGDAPCEASPDEDESGSYASSY
ncbi:Heterokaryon incompatibility protein (HET) domain containing protein [Rhypophila sp. PSN 637]